MQRGRRRSAAADLSVRQLEYQSGKLLFAMETLEWELMNDYEFVHLCADLLRQLGFVDVHVQGDGPDGGFDLFATELLPYSVAGKKPFRWGIQCKFSKTGKRRSVNDSEINDVEGILRSDRYAAQEVRGYLLITNRRITQNVIERLSGIDRRSFFRACHIDGIQLCQLLSDNPKIVQKYFGEITQIVRKLGKPVIDVPLSKEGDDTESIRPQLPQLPLIEVAVNPPGQVANSVKLTALIDTGSHFSFVSAKALKKLEDGSGYCLPVIRRLSVGGELVPCFSIEMHVQDWSFSELEVITLSDSHFDVAELWIGANVLEKMVVLIDGKKIQLWQRV